MNSALLPHHLQDLETSGITPETAKAAGLYSETSYDRLAGRLNRKRYGRQNGPALAFPHHDETGAVILHRVRPDNPPRNGDGKPCKYLGPTGTPKRAFFPPGVHTLLANPGATAFITEGEKKGLRASQDSLACIGLSGVENRHSKGSSALFPDPERIGWKDRPVHIVFDSDAAANENVRTAESLLAAALASHGAAVRAIQLGDPSIDLQARSESRISATGVIHPETGTLVAGSATNWHLAARDANHRGLILGHLVGNRYPAIRSFQLQQGRWGMGWDVRHDLGIKCIGFESLYMSTGTG
jgi:hypothetical protein